MNPNFPHHYYGYSPSPNYYRQFQPRCFRYPPFQPNQTWHQRERPHGFRFSRPPLQASTPVPMNTEEQNELEQAKKRMTAERVDAAVKEISRKLSVKNQVEILKQKLQSKQGQRSGTNTEGSVSSTSSFEASPSPDDSEKAVIDSNQRFREPIMEMFDLPMTNKDFRQVGTGQLTSSNINDDVTNEPLKKPEENTSKSNCKAAEKRSANKQITRKKKKKKPRKRAEIPIIPDRSVTKAKERLEFERVAQKLKQAIREKDKSWLSNLVHDQTSVASKRILLSKLMEENHAAISRELAAIRFSGKCTTSIDNSVPPTEVKVEVTQADLQLLQRDQDLVDVDFSDLPDDLFSQIEDFIKREVGSEEDSDIIEVPVPEKPPVEVVTLDEVVDNEDSSATSSSTDLEKSPFAVMKLLTEEESSLFGQLKLLEVQKHEILTRLDNLREQRLQIILKNQGSS